MSSSTPSRRSLVDPKVGGAVVLVSLFAILSGLGSGFFLVGFVREQAAAAARTTDVAVPVDPAYTGDTRIVQVPPIVTNLRAPSTVWVRLEVSLLTRGASASEPPSIAAITNAITSYIRTLDAGALEGAAGLDNLRDDLNFLMGKSDDGVHREVIIHSLVLQ